MIPNEYLFTSESVSPGHPDKLCDRISDAILDSYLAVDPDSHVAVECMATSNKVIISGEVSSKHHISRNEIENIARSVIAETGYTKDEYLFTDKKVLVEVLLNTQSPDIAMGVDRAKPEDQGAGDQGIMFGYACDETPDLMPLPIMLSHDIMKYFHRVLFKGHQDTILRPDAKSQVTVKYVNDEPVHIDTILISHQHDDIPQEDVVKYIKDGLRQFIDLYFVEYKKYPLTLIDPTTKYLFNPTGKFVIGGPVGDTGLTGRKIIVDTYGGRACHGGGAFSGKDPSKVDRSAAYMARYVAKNLVATGLMKRCQVQLSYGIGISHPISVYVTSFNTCEVPDYLLSQLVTDYFDLTPYGIIKHLDLKHQRYFPTAFGGHFGRESFSWEKTDKAKELTAIIQNMSKI